MAQLRAISSRMRSQELSALQGGCVAGETEMQRRTSTWAARPPISARQERGPAAADAEAQAANIAAQAAAARNIAVLFRNDILSLTSAIAARSRAH